MSCCCRWLAWNQSTLAENDEELIPLNSQLTRPPSYIETEGHGLEPVVKAVVDEAKRIVKDFDRNDNLKEIDLDTFAAMLAPFCWSSDKPHEVVFALVRIVATYKTVPSVENFQSCVALYNRM